MSRETIWLIIAGLAALSAVPLIYMGLQKEAEALLKTGFGLFTLGMIISPVMRIAKTRKQKIQAREESAAMRRA